MTRSSLSPQQLCPYLIVKGAQAAIDFYVRAFGATVDFTLIDPSDGRIGHAELRFGATRLFLADEYPDFGAVGPERLGGSPVKLHLDVADADAFVAHAVQHGASILRPVKLEFHGHRSALLSDPFGYSWVRGKPGRRGEPTGDATPLEPHVRARNGCRGKQAMSDANNDSSCVMEFQTIEDRFNRAMISRGYRGSRTTHTRRLAPVRGAKRRGGSVRSGVRRTGT